MSDVWGTVPAWVGAVGGSVGTAIALVALVRVNVRDREDRRRVHAAKVSTFISRRPPSNQSVRSYLSQPDEIFVSNAGTNAIHGVQVILRANPSAEPESRSVGDVAPGDTVPSGVQFVLKRDEPSPTWSVFFADDEGRFWMLRAHSHGSSLSYVPTGKDVPG